MRHGLFGRMRFAASGGAAPDPAPSGYVGIPAPPFGLTETVESVYGSADYYTYWVDNTSGAATDSGNTYGSPAKPRLTLPPASALTSGDVIQVRGGPYTGSTWTVGAAGTAVAPVIIRGASAASRSEIQRAVRVSSASYLVFEYLHWTTLDTPLDVRPNADGVAIHHLAVRDCEVTGTGAAASGAAFLVGNTAYDTPITDCVFLRNYIHDCGDWQGESENDLHGLGVGAKMQRVWYLDNEVCRLGGDGVGNGHDANYTTHDLYVGGNTIYDCRENAIDLKEVYNVIISQNVCHGFAPTGSSEGAAIVLHYGPTTGQGPYNVWVLGNTIYDATYGLVTSEVHQNVVIVGNVVFQCDHAINPDRGGGNVAVYHNTLVDCGDGIVCDGSAADALDGLALGGNIVANITSGDHLRVYSSGVRAATTAANENYYQEGGNVSVGWGSTYWSVADWIVASGIGSGSLEIDPQFVNANTRDYRTTAAACVGAGLVMDAAQAVFASVFPDCSLMRDAAGSARPSGEAWDLGAYQQ